MRRVGVLVLAVTFVLAGVMPLGEGTAFAGSAVRMWGSDRFGTAVAFSQYEWPAGSPQTVFVATGLDFPDALAAGGGSGLVFPTRKDRVPPDVLAEISRLDPLQVVVVGGPAVVSDEVVSELMNATRGSVIRLAGSDRFGTAVALSQYEWPGSSPETLYVATGLDFPDALAAGGGNGTILLTRKDSVPSVTLSEIQRLNPWEVVVVGGAGVVSDQVVSQLQAAGSWSVTRLWGADRFATAVAVSQHEYPDGAGTVYVATGFDFPDALAAGGGNGPILLTRKDSVPAVTAAELQRLHPAEVVVVGGPAVVSDQVLIELQGIVVPSGSDDPSQRATLMTLYNTAGGSSWWHRTGWGGSGSYCTWYGVSCGSGHDVEALRLPGNGLSGPIPSQVGSLTHLRNLDLSGNSLSGWIPSQLGGLTSLRTLDLSDNRLSGPVPSELGNLASLETLDLYFNQDLSGSIPSQLGGLTSLRVLDLGLNHLSGSIPSQLGGLTSLRVLDVGMNHLSGSIPSQLGNLTSLERLDLSSQVNLSGSIPSQLGGLTSLRVLDLWGNHLSGSIPSQLGSLTNLRVLRLAYNDLSGVAPATLMNLTGLTELTLKGQTGCLTAETPLLAAWLTSMDPDWWPNGC